MRRAFNLSFFLFFFWGATDLMISERRGGSGGGYGSSFVVRSQTRRKVKTKFDFVLPPCDFTLVSLGQTTVEPTVEPGKVKASLFNLCFKRIFPS